MVKTKFYAILLAVVFCFSGSIATVNAQTMSEKEIKKIAKKEAKKNQKEGWIVNPGALPLEQQLIRAYTMANQMNDEGYPKFIVGEGKSTAEAYDAAKMQANERAKQEIASKTQTELVSEIKSTVSNNQISPEEAASVVEVIEASRSVIAQSIGRLIPIMEAHRKLENKNVEVLVRVAYNADNIKKAAKQAIRNEMKKRGNDMHKKLEEYGYGQN